MPKSIKGGVFTTYLYQKDFPRKTQNAPTDECESE